MKNTKRKPLKNNVSLAIDNTAKGAESPSNTQIIGWINHAFDDQANTMEIAVKIVDEEESKKLNKFWRNKDMPTNVLSFPLAERIDAAPDFLGDLVMCSSVIQREAKDQHKNLEAHWAHIVIHGILHLQGYDHESEEEAEIMERREIDLLNKIGFGNPYA